MEELVDRLEKNFKEEVYPYFSSNVSVDEYINKVSEYLEFGFLVKFLQRFKGKTINEIQNTVLLGRNLGRYDKALLSVLLRFFHEQDERPRSILCVHPKRVVVGGWY